MMKCAQKPNSVHPTGQPHGYASQLTTRTRGQFERFDIINVQSLLNIRAWQSQRHQRNSSKTFQDRIIINVCGDRYETYRTTLGLYPDTLLGNEKLRKYYYDKERNEYFFDRNRACFEAILYYYQSHGRLRRPNFVPLDIFLEEVTFFQLGQEALNQLREDENIKEVKKVHLPRSHWRRRLWATMEYPDYSFLAKLIRIISLLMVLISTIALAVESLPQYEVTLGLDCREREGIRNNSNDTNTTIQYLPDGVYLCQDYSLSPFFIIQTVCVTFFTIELALRIISSPSFIDFIKNLMNWIDIISIVPYYISVGIYTSGRKNHFNSTIYVFLRLLRILRFVRVLKFYRVFRSIKSLRVLASTMQESIPDFFLMIIILTLLSFLFGAAVYFAEHDNNGQVYDSILKATYWGIITITSVGYGDMTPITPIGRIIACLCSLFGSAMIGMLVSVLVDRYQRVYARKLYKKEEIIDFDNYSSDDDETHSKNNISIEFHRTDQPNNIDERINSAFDCDNPEESNEINQISSNINNQINNDNLLNRQNSRVHFIIGYVDDQNQQTSSNLLETISSIIVDKQTIDENIQLSIISNDDHIEQKLSTDQDVQFEVSSTTSDEELTEINNNSQGKKGNVLKTFQSPSSLTDQYV